MTEYYVEEQDMIMEEEAKEDGRLYDAIKNAIIEWCGFDSAKEFAEKYDRELFCNIDAENAVSEYLNLSMSFLEGVEITSEPFNNETYQLLLDCMKGFIEGEISYNYGGLYGEATRIAVAEGKLFYLSPHNNKTFAVSDKSGNILGIIDELEYLMRKDSYADYEFKPIDEMIKPMKEIAKSA